MPRWMTAGIGELGKEDAWAGPNCTTEPAGLLPWAFLHCVVLRACFCVFCLLSHAGSSPCLRLSQILSVSEPCLSSPPVLSRGELSGISVPDHSLFSRQTEPTRSPVLQSSQSMSSPCAPQPEVLPSWSFHPSKTTVRKSSSVKRPEAGNWASSAGIFLGSPWSLIWALVLSLELSYFSGLPAPCFTWTS